MRIVALTLLCLSWFLLLPVSLAGQERREAAFQYLGKQDGLSQSSVFSIAQDSTGFLWFGTRDGLNRYDGFRVRVYRQGPEYPGLAGDDIRTLYADPRGGGLWVGTMSGLSRFDFASESFSRFDHTPTQDHSLPGEVVLSLLRTTGGQMWVGTSRGLGRLDEETGRFTRFYPGPVGEEHPSNNITFLEEMADGRLLVGTFSGLFVLEGDQLIDRTPPVMAGVHLICGRFGPDGRLWVGTRDRGVFTLPPDLSGSLLGAGTATEALAPLSHDYVRALQFTLDGQLWIGTLNGLNLLSKDGRSMQHYLRGSREQHGLLDAAIRSLLIDRAGSLWVGTYYGGAHHLDERYGYFTSYRHRGGENSLSADVVSSFAEDSTGNLWIGTEGGGLNFYDHTKERFLSFQHQPGREGVLTSNIVKQLLLDGQKLWIGTFRGGLNWLDTETGDYGAYRHDPTDPNSLSNDNIYGLWRGRHHLWALTYGRGLNLLDLRTQEFLHYVHDPAADHGISSNLTRTIAGGDSVVWLGTDQGLNRISLDEEGLPLRFHRLLPDQKVFALTEDRTDHLWIGTLGDGLFRLHKPSGSLRQYTSEDGLADNSVFGIVCTGAGTLWISTGNGLSRLDTEQQLFTNYGSSGGLDNLEFNFNAAHRTAGGELLFGGVNGYTRFLPDRILAGKQVPPVVLTSLLHNNRRVNPGGEDGLLARSLDQTEELTFPYNKANFTLEFAALDYFSPEHNRYAFKMEGLDRNWRYTEGVSQATYTIQRDGEYTFLLRGANSDGLWNDTVRELKITVLPPVWRSGWALLLYGILIGLGIYTTARFLRLRHRLQLQEIARRQQEELVEMRLRFFTNITHEFRTPLTLILGPLDRLLRSKGLSGDVRRQLHLIQRNGNRLLQLVDQILSFRKLATDHEPMAPEQALFLEFLREIFDSFAERAASRGIEYRFDAGEEDFRIWFDPLKLERVFFNLLSNAFKFTPDGGVIRLSVVRDQQRAIIRLADSGRGIPAQDREAVFTRFYEDAAGQQTGGESTGIGLALCRQMVLLHRGRIYVEDSGEDAGAVFVVELPVGRQPVTDLGISGTEQPAKLLPDKANRERMAPEVGADSVGREGKAATVLLVEDNPEIRDFVQQIFDGEYRVLTADSGLSGLEVARTELPDVVVSDVMMPGMDGLTMCHELKTDITISHIPVILLTARKAEPFRLEGLRTGADDYLTKPFLPEELRLRVRNIIRSRRLARDKFTRLTSLDPREVTVTNADEQFLEQALSVVEEHMGRVDFKVDEFAGLMAVSRSLLYTKLKALTGQTPNTFVKTLRLKRAAQLLATQQMNVSEVAYSVGFRDAKYFRKCFQEQFDSLPSAYVRAHE